MYIIVTLRDRKDLTYNLQTMFLKYRGEKYTIKSYPENKDFKDNTIQFVCVKVSYSEPNEDYIVQANDLNAELNIEL